MVALGLGAAVRPPCSVHYVNVTMSITNAHNDKGVSCSTTNLNKLPYKLCIGVDEIANF